MDDAAAWIVAALLDGGEPDMTLRVGDRAPDFALTAIDGEKITLSAFLGRPVVVVFLRWLG